MLFRRFHFVFDTLTSTVSGCSGAGYGQICGQKTVLQVYGASPNFFLVIINDDDVHFVVS